MRLCLGVSTTWRKQTQDRDPEGSAAQATERLCPETGTQTNAGTPSAAELA